LGSGRAFFAERNPQTVASGPRQAGSRAGRGPIPALRSGMEGFSSAHPGFRLRSWKAVVVLAGFVGLTTMRFQREHELPPLARETILLRLKADYARPVLETPAHGGYNRQALQTTATALAERQRVQIDRATVRGILWPKYVRVEVSVNGQPPPDGNPVRFFTIDWAGMAQSEVSGSKYYLRLW
jgi:hypothetical protein